MQHTTLYSDKQIRYQRLRFSNCRRNTANANCRRRSLLTWIPDMDRAFASTPCAEIVESALKFFDASRYHLIAWAVMPNHTHAVVTPCSGFELSDITHSWKSYSANQINRTLGRTGSLWHKESFDRIIRDRREFEETVRYVLNNPEAAGLKGWRWCGAKSPKA